MVKYCDCGHVIFDVDLECIFCKSKIQYVNVQKQISRKLLNKEYSKYVIVIPSKIVEVVDWKDKDKLQVIIENKKVTLIKKE